VEEWLGGSIRMQSTYTCTQIDAYRNSEYLTHYIVVLVLQETINTTSDNEFNQCVMCYLENYGSSS